jgi:hypothetical protein
MLIPGRSVGYSLDEDVPIWKEEVRAETKMDINAQLSFGLSFLEKACHILTLFIIPN